MKRLTTMAFALLIGGACAQAGDSKQFDQLDVDRNGAVDQNEAKQMPTLYQAFESADANQDGALDRSEFAKAIAQIDTQKKEPTS